MRRRAWSAIAIVAVGYMLLPGGSVLAGYGAIAWNREGGRIVAVWNQPTPQKAAEMALSQCGARGCRLVIKPTTTCAAAASTKNGKHIGAAARKTQDEARLAALTNCQKGKVGACAVRTSDCTK
jgi:hypothetical protein